VSFFSERRRFAGSGCTPFCDILSAVFSDKSESAASQSADKFCKRFLETAEARYPSLRYGFWGPRMFSLPAAGRYRRRLLIKCKNDGKMRALLREVIEWYRAKPKLAMMAIDGYYDRLSNITFTKG
jgi:primosomal protein N' (replication factor Y)